MPVIPIFMYHHVSTNAQDMVTVSADCFERSLKFIKEAGYRTLALDDVVRFMRCEQEVEPGAYPMASEPGAIALTFDDAYLDNYVFAWPLLKKYGVRATVFAVTSWLSKAQAVTNAEKKATVDDCRKDPLRHRQSLKVIEAGQAHRAVMNWDMAREMQDSGLVRFYSHTATHALCDVLGEAELADELKLSKSVIEAELGGECPYLCWPKGRFTDDAIVAAKKAGYKAVFTTRHGVARRGMDVYAINRIVARDRPHWLESRLKVYTNPLLSRLYSVLRKRG